METIKEKLRNISVKVPEMVYKELALRVPEGSRSGFVRDAIMEKLEKTPKPDVILELGERLSTLEEEFAKTRKKLADFELLAFDYSRFDPHDFCEDDIDRKIVDFLIHYRGATTPELAEYVGKNRWFVLSRLRRIQKKSGKRIGRPIVEYFAGERSGKRKAWWITEELAQT